MIVIYSVEHLARAMWADREESERATSEALRLPYRLVSWESAHELDRDEYMARAERVVRLCRAQAKELIS